MKELLEGIYDQVRGSWRFRWWGLALASAVAIAGWLFISSLPDRYKASASVFVDTRTALRPVLQGVTMEQDVNVQLNYVRQSLLSGKRLEQIAVDSGVITDATTDPRLRAEALRDFSSRIQLEVRSANGGESEREAGSIYSFSYLDGDRARSIVVAKTLVDTFIDETLGGKRSGSKNAQQFLEERIKDYEQQLSAAEDKRAEFKKANVGLMPTEQGGYFSQLQSEMDFTSKLQNDLSVAQLKRSELARQLRGESVLGATVPGSAVAGAADTVSRINEAQARLDELLLRFTDKHPDVLAARATLQELKQRRANELERLRSGDAGAAAASGISSSPVYQSIQLQLNQADVDVASLRGQLAQHSSKAAQLRQRMDVAPKVEAELLQLDRDYDIKKQQHAALLTNREKALLGDQADDAGSVRFELVQPPSASYSPVSPQRTLLLAGVLIAALGVGGALTYLLNLLSPVVGSIQGLADLTDLPVLGVVSAAFPHELASKARHEVMRFLSAGSLLIAAFFGVLVLNIMGYRFP